MKIKKCLAMMLISLSFALVGGCNDNDNDENRPNFITIVVDDMGFSDLGIYGGEIPTPNIDQLAEGGIALNDFYGATTSTPARGMLFTGKDHHQAGVGTMETQLTPELIAHGYEALLSLEALPFPELMQQNGYHTMFTGKWDFGQEPE